MSDLDRLIEWCDQHLDTDTFEGMYGAKERVEAVAAELGLVVIVHWDERPAWHPTLRRFEGAGMIPYLVIQTQETT
jgi:hypothetical protein